MGWAKLEKNMSKDIAEIFDALARVDRSTNARYWSFDCCSAKWTPLDTEPRIIRDSFHSADYYNASQVSLEGNGPPVSTWVTGGDMMKHHVKAGLCAWTKHKMPNV
jgi:hypothetical protein